MKSPLFVVGLGIPDLTSGFSRSYNSIIKKSVLPINEELKQVETGILSHYAADKAFHNSHDFMNLISLTINSFLDAGLSRERLRLSVIAHVAVELMIDRQILLENEQLCVDYYNLIDKANEDVLGTYFNSYNLMAAKTNFLTRFQFFKQRRFLFLFADIENIVTGLSRIYQNVTQVIFTDDEKSRFLTALNNIDTTIRYSWKEILNEKVYE